MTGTKIYAVNKLLLRKQIHNSSLLCAFTYREKQVLLYTILLSLTIVKVAEVSSVKEEMRSEKVSEPSSARPERERGVEMQAASPVGFSSQVVPYSVKMLE